MRTPGADFELAAGFLYGEGIIRSGAEIRGISHCEEPDLDESKRYNIVKLSVARWSVQPWDSSACNSRR